MKKIISVALALTMIFSVCSLSAFAFTNAATASLAISSEPAENFVAAPAKAGDMFELAVNLGDLDAGKIISAQAVVTWDPTKLQVVKADGTEAKGGTGYIKNAAAFPAWNSDEETGAFQWINLLSDGAYDITAWIDPGSEYAKVGVPLAENTKNIDFVKIRFKVLAEGDTKLNISKVNLFLDDLNNAAKVTITPANIVIGGTTPPAKKTVTAIEAPVVAAEATVGDTVTLPATVKATVDGAAEDLTVAWTPATVDTTKAGTVTVKGVVDTKDYEVAEGVKTEYEFTVTVSEKPVAKKTVTAIEAPVVAAEANVGDTVTLPATVKATVDGAAEDLTVTWTPAAVDTTKAGTVTVKGVVDTKDYEVAEGVKTEYEFTVTVNEVVTPPAPEVNKVVKVVTPIPADAAKLEDLPTTVQVVYEGSDTTVEVEVEWTLTVSGWTMAFKSADVQFADKVVDASDNELNVSGGLVVPFVEADTLVKIVDAAITDLTSGGSKIEFTVELNPDYKGEKVIKDGEIVYVYYTLFNNGVPVLVDVTPVVTLGESKSVTISATALAEFTSANLGAAVGVVDPSQVFEHPENGLGDPIGYKNGVTK